MVTMRIGGLNRLHFRLKRRESIPDDKLLIFEPIPFAFLRLNVANTSVTLTVLHKDVLAPQNIYFSFSCHLSGKQLLNFPVILTCNCHHRRHAISTYWLLTIFRTFGFSQPKLRVIDHYYLNFNDISRICYCCAEFRR